MIRAITQVHPSAFDSAIWKTRSVDVQRAAKAVINWSITINVVASMGTFNAALLATELTNLQQVAALSMWAVLIYASAFVRPSLRLELTPDRIALVAFYVLAAVSVFWTSLSPASLMKSSALVMTTFGAFCLITRVEIDDIVKSTSRGLFILVAASVFCAIFA